MKQPMYHFKSNWHVATDLMTAEQTIIDMHTWMQWWDGLINAEIVQHKDAVIGSVIIAQWKSMFGYRISMQITITGYVPGVSIAFLSEGELVGQGSWTFTATSDHSTQMDVDWNVTTQKTWMNLTAPLLKPIFIRAHNDLMKKGERGLQVYLADQSQPK